MSYKTIKISDQSTTMHHHNAINVELKSRLKSGGHHLQSELHIRPALTWSGTSQVEKFLWWWLTFKSLKIQNYFPLIGNNTKWNIHLLTVQETLEVTI